MEEVGVGGVGVPGHPGSTGENRPGRSFESFFWENMLRGTEEYMHHQQGDQRLLWFK